MQKPYTQHARLIHNSIVGIDKQLASMSEVLLGYHLCVGIWIIWLGNNKKVAFPK